MMPVIGERPSVYLDRLLCATDFSTNSECAAAFASALAKRFGCSLELLHVFDPSICMTYEEAELMISLRERQQTRTEYLEKACDISTKDGVRCSAILKSGHPAWKEILAEARRYDAGMIVAGTQSKQGLERFMIGSTAEQLIRNAECPVLTVGPHVKMPSAGPLCFENIVFATDFTSTAAKAELVALAFAEDCGAHLSICHVQNFDKEPAAEVRPLGLSNDWCTIDSVVKDGEASDAILDLAAKKHAELIVLGARRGSFWLTHVETGVTLNVIREATCPVLTFC